MSNIIQNVIIQNHLSFPCSWRQKRTLDGGSGNSSFPMLSCSFWLICIKIDDNFYLWFAIGYGHLKQISFNFIWYSHLFFLLHKISYVIQMIRSLPQITLKGQDKQKPGLTRYQSLINDILFAQHEMTKPNFNIKNLFKRYVWEWELIFRKRRKIV